MKAKVKLLSIVLGLFVLVTANISQAELIGFSSGCCSPGGVYRIDEATGQAVEIVDMSLLTAVSGASFLDGNLWGSDVWNTTHYGTGTIDINTGGFTSFGDQDGSMNWHGLASDEDAGLLYSIDIDDSYILKSMTADGTITSIGTGTGISGSGMAYDDTNDILYAVDSLTDNLFSVDTSTGLSTLIGSAGINVGQVGLAYDETNNILYANSTGELYTVNVSTGAFSLIGVNGVSLDWAMFIDALAWRESQVPEPTPIAITLSKAKVKFNDIPDNDEFEINGEFVLGEGNNGIDPVNEDVTVTVGTSSIVIPSPFAFAEETAGRFKFKGAVNGADVKMEIKETNFNTFGFKVRAKGVDLTGTCNPVDIEIIVGDDAGQTDIRLNGLLKVDDGSSDDSHSGHKKKKKK